MIISGNTTETSTQLERDKAGRRHLMRQRLRSIGWSSLSLGFAVTVVGMIATRLVS